jgi:hypothetical protein
MSDPISLEAPQVPLLGEKNKTVAMRAFDGAIKEVIGQALGYNLPPQALGMNLLASALSLFVQGEVAGMMRAVNGPQMNGKEPEIVQEGPHTLRPV